MMTNVTDGARDEAFTVVRWEVVGKVALVTLDDPMTSNALGATMANELGRALDRLEAATDMAAMVLTGAGRSFCSGGHIGEFPATAVEGRRYLQRTAAGVPSRIERVRKPVIAAVNGPAMGGGFALALACDIVFASHEARFGMTEASLGLAPGFGIVRLHEVVGRHRAKQLMMTAERISAEEAWRLGIVNKVVSSGTLLEEAMEIAKQIASNAPLAVEVVKAAVNRDIQGNDVAYMIDAMDILFGTEDAREGFRAFLDKRKPVFKGS